MNSRLFAQLKLTMSVRVTPEVAERLSVVAEKLHCSISKAAAMAVSEGVPVLERQRQTVDGLPIGANSGNFEA